MTRDDRLLILAAVLFLAFGIAWGWTLMPALLHLDAVTEAAR